ncbi:MAG: hypothetical protein TR69_WS6001001248 [candidate division WS6 bacterium OLB20]|uniref:DNA-binding protein n=1 Tax=candidate division WS6 bacterium OLB20 TaxID=1617426 RepID=A0A136LX82_9BACT|nr:MAG: hypothetical protein TR69_WS6001001248 [candidate division WS6 bacterium OLB20]
MILHSTPLPKTGAPATRALNEFGITSLEQLTGYSEEEILSLHGMGPKAFGILKAALEERGLAFKRY